MPKARKRGKATGRKNTAVQQIARPAAVKSTTAGVAGANRPVLSPPVRGVQSLFMPGLVALGCWGLAFSFTFLSTDPNHLLYGGMAAFMALFWSVSFAIRLRKLLAVQQRRT